MKKLTAAWVRKAESDLRAAKSLAKLRPPVHDEVCFHCQQAAEKYLKALLQEFGLMVPRIHELLLLLQRLIAHDRALAARFASLQRGLDKLTP